MKWRRICESRARSFPGFRPGKRTADYLNSILVRLTTVGAIYLVIVCLIPSS